MCIFYKNKLNKKKTYRQKYCLHVPLVVTIMSPVKYTKPIKNKYKIMKMRNYNLVI